MSVYAESVPRVAEGRSAPTVWRPTSSGLGRVVKRASRLASILHGYSASTVAAAVSSADSPFDFPSLSFSADRSVASFNSTVFNSSASASPINASVASGLPLNSTTVTPPTSIATADAALTYFNKFVNGTKCDGASIVVRSTVLQPVVDEVSENFRFEASEDLDFQFTLTFDGVARDPNEGNSAFGKPYPGGGSCFSRQGEHETAAVVLIRPASSGLASDTPGLASDTPERSLLRRWEATYMVRRGFDKRWNEEKSMPRVCVVPDLRVGAADGGDGLLRSTAQKLHELLAEGGGGLYDSVAVHSFRSKVNDLKVNPNDAVQRLFEDEIGRCLLYEIMRASKEANSRPYERPMYNKNASSGARRAI